MSYLPVVSWKENVAKWIVDCLEDRGVPMFRLSHYDGELAVTGVCWGGKNRVTSVKFVGVPEEDMQIITNVTGEWHIFLKKYGTDELKGRVREALVVGDGDRRRVIEFPRAPWEVGEVWFRE